jgi:hypothetical protein
MQRGQIDAGWRWCWRRSGLSASIKIALALMRSDTGNDWVFWRAIGGASGANVHNVHAQHSHAEIA